MSIYYPIDKEREAASLERERLYRLELVDSFKQAIVECYFKGEIDADEMAEACCKIHEKHTDC